MSAHVVDKPTIDVLVKAAAVIALDHEQTMAWWTTDEDGDYTGWRCLWPSRMGAMPQTNEDELGQMLWDECVRSVRYRYPADSETDYELPGDTSMPWIQPYVYEDPRFAPSPGEVFKTIDYYSYQSCEHPEWRASEPFAFCVSLRSLYCKRVPGYAEAPYGWDDDDVQRRRLIDRTLSLNETARGTASQRR